MEGRDFGRYHLIELLGRGGMGEVWRAHDTATDRVVAIKLLTTQLSENQDFQRRFRREAHAAARLSTPHVVPIHDYGEIDGQLYVDMRLIEGRDLQTVLADGPLEPARAVHIIDGVAKALQAAHEVGLLHRDVKPSNVLVDRHDFAYLIDFGIARALDDTRMTKAGHAIGTFQYIAPERLGNEIEEDARADVYSLACVLYECLTGQPPFAGETMAQLVAAHLTVPPPRLSVVRPDLPAQLDQVIAIGMAKRPELRYPTALQLVQAARDAISAPAGPEPAVRPEPPALPPARPWWRHPAAVISAVAALAAAAIVLVVALAGAGDRAVGSGSQTAQAGPTRQPALPNAADLLTQSYRNAVALTSAHLVQTVTGDIPGMPFRTVDGDITTTPSAGAAGKENLRFAGSDTEVDFVVIDGTLFAALQPGDWTNLGAASDVYDPTAVLNPGVGIAHLLANFTDAKAAGIETINGVETLRIAGQVRGDAVNKFVPKLAATGPVPATAWIRTDGEHQIVQFQLDPSAGKSLVMTFSNWNAPVTVAKPPGV
ncbi:hypothetical protein BST27_11035 [Mycobacterium intermedium]|uniref:non-specific serine/threonine protein kinase n=1 Tax=Mycobacterium intermedium TaxID=28445 RepID=A0A1E3SHU6_MYCIE|nr:LppX_LprAFG lipoprotein [Mycobacterium intermedium]MCV6964879.1 LppX_LprAFG lipoprotein [Mycobacterium intermedium]ODR01652.1 hypothetical protein BHQ20_07605 [Mycobacterium intermedium]OPE46023.1 hypothetical protein BV508_27565 [Mycobacterium intermedium]ORB06294.1 hypothetical protein BST27_11035 [Mycobacterium intermedium]